MDDGLPIDSELEWKLCAAAIPGMLLAALAFHAGAPFLQRTFLAMPVHELGHAATAWLCGYSAVPTLWRTLVPEERGFVAAVLLACALAYGIFRACESEKWLLAALCAGMLALQGVGTFYLHARTAQMLITFGGDGLGMVIAILLMASFFFGKRTQLYRGGLRWGFLAIGAAAYVDMYSVWAAARHDYGRIPFGEQEGVGLSDAARLVDWYGWTADQLVHRYFVLGLACLAALAAVYAWGVWRAWRYAQE